MLDIDDVDLMLHEVERFCHSELQACADQSQSPISSERLGKLTTDLEQMGVLNFSEDTGAGLWEHCDSIASQRYNVEILKTVAAMSAGVAFHWHRIALSRWLLKSVDLEYQGPARDITLLTQGHHGLARDALARWFRQTSLDDDHSAVLKDWLNNSDQDLYLHACPEWSVVLMPRWHQGAIQWSLSKRTELETVFLPYAPGFDELGCYRLHVPADVATISLSAQSSRDCLNDLLILDAIGLMAIGLGSLQRAARLARDYAHARIQGGSRIVEHPAVGLMLGDIQIALQSCELQLGQLQQGLAELDLASVMSARATLHPLLCKAADQAIQVHGGIGYMRDCGVEKVWREQHMLRRLSGTTTELRLFISTLENCA